MTDAGQESVMRCSRCGTEVMGKQLYCSECGAEIISNKPGYPGQQDAEERYFEEIEHTLRTRRGSRLSDWMARNGARTRMMLTAIGTPIMILCMVNMALGFLLFLILGSWDDEGLYMKLFFIPMIVSSVACAIALVRFYIRFLKRFREIRASEKASWGEMGAINASIKDRPPVEPQLSREAAVPAAPPAPRKYLYRRPYKSPVKRRPPSRDTSYSALQVGSLSLMPIPFFGFPFAALAFILAFKSHLEEKRGEPVTEGAKKYRIIACVNGCLGLAINIYITIVVI